MHNRASAIVDYSFDLQEISYPTETKSPSFSPDINDMEIEYENSICNVLRELGNYVNSNEFCMLFTVKDALSLSIVCREFHQIFNPKFMDRLIRLGNLDEGLRTCYWIRQAPFFSLLQKYRKRLQLPSIFDNVYEKIQEVLPTTTQYYTLRAMIKKDVGRTFDFVNIKINFSPSLCGNENEQEENKLVENCLERILLGVGYIYPHIGYCQGMNFIAAILLYVLEEEELSFWTFVRLIKQFKMRSLYITGVPGLHLKNYEVNKLVQKHLPKLSAYLKKINLTTDYFTSKWIMTLFSCYFPIHQNPQIFDQFFESGWIGIYRIIIGLFSIFEEEFLKLDMTQICKYLKSTTHTEAFNIQSLLIHANSIIIDNAELKSYSREYLVQKAQLKLVSPVNEWEVDQIPILKWAKEEIEKLDPMAKKDVKKFQSKIEKIDKELEEATMALTGGIIQYKDIKNEYETSLERKNILYFTEVSLKNKLDYLLALQESKNKKNYIDRIFRKKTYTVNEGNDLHNTSLSSKSPKINQKVFTRKIKKRKNINHDRIETETDNIQGDHSVSFQQSFTHSFSNQMDTEPSNNVNLNNTMNLGSSTAHKRPQNASFISKQYLDTENLIPHINQLGEDIELIEKKISSIDKILINLRGIYYKRKNIYEDLKSTYDDLHENKKLAMKQLNQIVLLYEEKKQNINLKLMKRLKQSQKFKRLFQF